MFRKHKKGFPSGLLEWIVFSAVCIRVEYPFLCSGNIKKGNANRYDKLQRFDSHIIFLVSSMCVILLTELGNQSCG